MKIKIACWLIIFCFLVPLSGMASKMKTPKKGHSLITLSVDEAGIELQNLRKIKGHFSGGKWHDSVDKWMGRKHQLMLYLQEQFGANQPDEKRIIQIMDEPEAVLQISNRNDYQFFANALSKELKDEENKILIYYWRGSHDFLYFVLRNDKLFKSDWWMALE